MAETMQAVRQHSYGGPEVLTLVEEPVPTPGPGEILVRVHAAAINPIDCAVRSGNFKLQGQAEDPFPMGVGWDVAGEIVAMGDDDSGRTDFSIGDRVFAFARFPNFVGAYAEYVAAPAAEFAHLPKRLDFTHAAGVPLAALTAWQSIVGAGQLKKGERVLIHAAAGGVGHFAVQIAKAKGATVIGTGSGKNSGFISDLGADEFIDYTTTKFEEAVSDIDVQLVPFAADFRPRCWGVMRAGGRVVSIKGPIAPEEHEGLDIQAAAVFVHPDGAELAEITKLIDSDAVQVTLDSVHPLKDASRAHARVETGHARGKVVLEV